MSIAEKLTTIAENEQKVYEAGKQAEYDEFWDAYQSNGNRRDYQYAFRGSWWKQNILKPKYDIIATNLQQAFASNQHRIDLVEYLNSLGVKLDTSQGCRMQQCFEASQYTRIGEIITINTEAGNAQIFNNCNYLETIDRFVVCENNKLTMCFNGNNRLKNITMGGTIGTSISFNWSPLSVESMKSIISCLKDYSGTDKAYTYEIKFTNACWEALEADSTAPDGNSWADYVFNLGWNT